MKEEMMYMPKDVADAFIINPGDFEKFKAIKPALSAHGVDMICDSMVEVGKFIATGPKASELAKMIGGIA
ncbi:hypothetical protein WG886_004357 [Yersinia enterocolitica]